MSLVGILAVALGALWGKKSRNLLTISGVAIGVFALTTIVALGQGLSAMIADSIANDSNLRQIRLLGGAGIQQSHDRNDVEISGEMSDERRLRLRRAALNRRRMRRSAGRRLTVITDTAIRDLSRLDHVETVQPLVMERYRLKVGDHSSEAAVKFGASTDIVFVPPEPLWVARPLTRRGEFTEGIEGPACDSKGNILAVNFARQGTIGRVRPNGAGELFVKLPSGSVGNGIRFARDGSMYVADYPKHNVLRVDPRTREITTFAHNDAMNQPNDLAIARDGTLYASDPAWPKGSGQLWRIDGDGKTTRLAVDMGTTNGIEVSPDGRTLYVNESVQRNIWAFTITDNRTLKDKRLLRNFEDHGFDGMRCDVEGNLYITRYGKGTVVKLSAAGEILREIDVLGSRPSNICFGGPDGRTAYVTEVEHSRLVTFRVDRPGLAWQRWQPDE